MDIGFHGSQQGKRVERLLEIITLLHSETLFSFSADLVELIEYQRLLQGHF